MYKNFGLGILSVAAIGVGFTFYFSQSVESVPVGIVVPHHDMVASARQAYFEKVRAQVNPKTLVVLVPDHFNQSPKPIITSSQAWQTILGDITADRVLIDSLALPKLDEPFQSEHGLTVLLKDIKNYFSDSLIVPVMLSRTATFAEVADFMQNLNQDCPDCLVVASVDFSHTNTANVAYLHDELALRELHQLDAAALYKYAEVDSPEALSALAMWAKLHGARQFNLFSHTNSGYLTGASVGEMTTHIIGGYQRGLQNVKHDDGITLMMGGDVMFARSVYAEYQNSSTSPFAQLGDRFFWGADVSLVNVEGVFTQQEKLQEGWNKIPPVLKFTPDTAILIKGARISVAGLANNHTFDGGTTDADFSKGLLEEQGVSVIGYPRTAPGIFLKEEGRLKVAVIALALHESNSDVAAQVRLYSEKGYTVVVYVHWGEEYTLTHTPAQEQIAQRLIEAGADLVVGSHPHLVQDVGVYQDVPIVYSLGNLLFDQEFRPETQVGAVLGVKLSLEEVELFLIPVGSYNKSIVLPAAKYRSYLDIWTSGWSEYRQDFDRFVFPIKL